VRVAKNHILTGTTDSRDSHEALYYSFFSAHFNQNKVLHISFSRVLNIQGVSKMFEKFPVGVLHNKTKKTIHISIYKVSGWV
jgi:hypothetical protein